VNIVRVAQAISTEAHTGVFRSCGDLYINHPAVVAARLAAFVSVLRQSSQAWLHDTIDEGTWVAVGFLRTARLPEASSRRGYRCPPLELYFGLVPRAAVDPIGQVRGTRRQRRGQRR